jgi:hypothetical protein
MRTTHAMRARGIRVDPDRAEVVQTRFRGIAQTALAEIGKINGRAVRIEDVRSPDVVGDIFQRAGIRCPLTPKTRKPSVTKSFLEALEHPLGALVRQARQAEDFAEKFVGAYILGGQHRGRIHAEIHQLRDEEGGTRTTRLSYSNPPLQQMPARDPILSPLVRGIFLPEEGEWWAAPDYCHDDQTEVLTEQGWRLFANLGTERVAQWRSGVVEFVRPTDRCVGEARPRTMRHLWSPRQLDMMVTENHRCLLETHRAGQTISSRWWQRARPTRPTAEQPGGST